MRDPHELGRPGALKEFLEGAGVGIAFILLVMLILSGFGVYTASGVSVNSGILLGLMIGLGAAFLEEPVFRGIMLRLLDKRYGATIAISIVSVVFGLIHTANGFVTGEFSYWGAVAIVVEAGVLLNAAYYFTRRLWFPIGLHAAWNFSLGGIFGLRVSGIDPVRGLIQGSLNGPELLTGGSFGPEGSLVTVALGLSLGLALLLKARRKGNLTLQA
jgi:membrane protease YdiL (CAAX protease family)